MKSLVHYLQHSAIQLQICHWQTTNYAEHKALGMAYDSITSFTDKLVEILAGQNRESITDLATESLPALTNLDAISVTELVQSVIDKLEDSYSSVTDNVVNEMQATVSELQKVLYLLTLN